MEPPLPPPLSQVRAAVVARQASWLRSAIADKVWQVGGCQSWYKNNETGDNVILWPAYTFTFWWRSLWCSLADFELTAAK